MLQLKNLGKVYQDPNGSNTILENINLDIAQGERVILLGSSGSGKSTLLNLISTIDDPSSGQIFFDNQDLTAMNQNLKTKFRRENLGFIFQFFNLIPTLTVEENINFVLELNNRHDPEYIHELCSRVGISDKLKVFPDQLSGGQQQRVAIVRSLAHKPKLIIADEPTGNLDSDTASQVIALLDDLINISQATLVMATHSISTLSLATKVYRVEHKGLVLQ